MALSKYFKVSKSGVDIFRVPIFGVFFLALQQNLEIPYQRPSILLIFIKQFLYC